MGLGGVGCLADGIVRYFKNRNTWPCLLLFLVSLETVLTVALQPSPFLESMITGAGTPSAWRSPRRGPSCTSSVHLG